MTSHDVARVAGVSQATVSRVLQGSPAVRPETRERVVEALRSTGFTPNAIARAMVTRSTNTIGVVVQDIRNPFYPELLEALSGRIASAGRRMILWTSGAAGEPGAIDAINQRLVDGVIFASATGDSPALEAALAGHALFVLVNRYVEGVHCDTVTTDNAQGARLVCDHLADLGHTRVALVGSAPHLSTASEREAGFRAAMAARGLELPSELVLAGEPGYDVGWNGMQALMALDRPPTAIFGMNDLTAIGALSAAAGAGVRVPDDVSIVGFDNIAMGAWEPLSLTTISQPIPTMATLAVDLLLDRIDRPTREPEHATLAPELVERGTTRAP